MASNSSLYRGVEILKYSSCPRASYLKKVTCLDKILLVLFFLIELVYIVYYIIA